MSQDRDKRLIEPGTRQALAEEWRSDPQAVIDKAEEADLTLEGYANARAPACPESPGSAMEFLLYNQGIRMTDTLDVPSTLGSDLPNVDPIGVPAEPAARALMGYWDEVYRGALITGYRATASASALTAGGAWRPYYDEAPVRSPQIAPGFNFLEVVAYTRGIREDKFRVRRWTNATNEQKMQNVAEGTEPKLFEMTRASDDVTLQNYRAAVEWTDDFINDPQTRAADITNAIEEIGIGHRAMLLEDLGKLVHDSRPSGNEYTATGTIAGQTHTAGELSYPFWVTYLKLFGNAYIPNVTLGSPVSITNLELMSMQRGNAITYGSWSMVPNTNIRNLNGDLTEMNYGYISGSNTGFSDTELFTFQREVCLVFVMQMGMNQDELERVAGPRKTRRWLGAKSAFAASDPSSIRSISY